APGEPIIGYRELRGRSGVQRRFRKLTLTPSYNLQTGVPFAYQGGLDPSASDIYISFVEMYAALDMRDDRVHPRRGAFFTANVQYAGVGGDARDVRVSPEARFYLPVDPGSNGFALRVTF